MSILPDISYLHDVVRETELMIEAHHNFLLASFSGVINTLAYSDQHNY